MSRGDFRTPNPPNVRDEQGDPPRRYYVERVSDRLVVEMLGICRGMLADGVVSEDEALALRRWVHANPDVAMRFPGNVLSDRLLRMYADGVIDDEEREDLAGFMRDLVGEDMESPLTTTAPTAIGYDDPLPTLIFDGWEYVFTGRFAYGPRTRCARAVEERGGFVRNALTGRTRVLVVGAGASPAWVTAHYGLKIAEAVEARAAGHPIFIVPEEHWVISLGDA